MCVKPQMRLYVCHRVGPFGVQLGSNWGFNQHSNKNRCSDKNQQQDKTVFGQECSSDKNSSLDFKKRANETSKNKRTKRVPLHM